jgi:hypothetical protein
MLDDFLHPGMPDVTGAARRKKGLILPAVRRRAISMPAVAG